MSSISNLPYGKILDYWYEKLANNPYRYKFLLTKLFEIFAFKSHSGKGKIEGNYYEFPIAKANIISINSKISIVIPTYIRSDKDQQDISNLLLSIEKQILKPSEVIIVDDCSPIKFSFPTNVSVYQLEQNVGPAKARNIGKSLAVKNGTEIIAFTDTDCILSETWTSIILQSFLEFKEFQILSGDTSAYDDNWFGSYHNINGTLNGRKMKNTDRLLYGTTANLAITKDVAINIDFNERFPIAAGEDIDFCFRANKEGYAIKYIPTMSIRHHFGYKNNLLYNLKRFIKQFIKYGQGEKILLSEIPNYYAYFDKTEEIPIYKNGC